MIADLLTPAAADDFDLADALDPSNDIGVKDKNKGGRNPLHRIRFFFVSSGLTYVNGSRCKFQTFRALSHRQRVFWSLDFGSCVAVRKDLSS